MKIRQARVDGWRTPQHIHLGGVLVILWCVSSLMALQAVATFETSGLDIGALQQQRTEKTVSKVVVEGVVYCGGTSQHRPLKDAKVKVECNNRWAKVAEIGNSDTRGIFSVTLRDYDYEAWGSNGCEAKLVSSSITSCTTPTNIGGGLSGTKLVLKEKSKGKVVLSAGPFAFKQSRREDTSPLVNNLQKSLKTKSVSSNIPRSELWYSPPNTYDNTFPPHYESPPYQHEKGDHKSHDNHHKSEESGHESHRRSSEHGEHRDHKSRNKDCSPARETRHHKPPAHHSPIYYYKSPPTPYHSEHHDNSLYHKPSYGNKDYPPPHLYTFPPPRAYHDVTPPYAPVNYHTQSPPPHYANKSPLPPHYNHYGTAQKQYYPPPYYHKTANDTVTKARKTNATEEENTSP